MTPQSATPAQRPGAAPTPASLLAAPLSLEAPEAPRGTGRARPPAGALAPGGVQGGATGSRPVRVAAVVPCFNRRHDLRLLLDDLAKVELRVDGVALEMGVVVVDNCSTEPLWTLPAPAGLRVEHVRMRTNRGGSGGFNAGMAHALAGQGKFFRDGHRPDFVWVIDSDARVTPGALAALVRELRRDPGLVAAGSALRDPVSGVTYELGGRVDRARGTYVPARRGEVDRRAVVEADYLAACSALVRREAIERAGLMPDVFLNGDDVLWFIRLKQATGGRVAAVARSVAFHPHWARKFNTGVRYYTARNGLSPVLALDLPATTRARRAAVEIFRACAQTLMGHPQLGAMHLDGLRDALDANATGPAPPGRIAPSPLRPLALLEPELARLKAQSDERRKGRGRNRASRVWAHPLATRLPFGTPTVRRALRAVGVRVPRRPRDARRIEPMGAERHPTEWLGAAWRLLAGPHCDVAVVPTGRATSLFRGRVSVQVALDGFLVADQSRWRTVGQTARTLARGVPLWWRTVFRPPAPVPLATITDEARRVLAEREHVPESPVLNAGGVGAVSGTPAHQAPGREA